MICSNKEPHLTSLKGNMAGRRRFLHPQSYPSPALCCACGLCIMLAGVNITLVGVFGIVKLLPYGNPSIVIGPLLLLLALACFMLCSICNCPFAAPPSHKATRQNRWGLMKMEGSGFETETSEHTLQDTTAIQLSPTNSPCSSHRSSPTHLPAVILHPGETSSSSHSSFVQQTYTSCQPFSNGDDTSPLSPSYDETDS